MSRDALEQSASTSFLPPTTPKLEKHEDRQPFTPRKRKATSPPPLEDQDRPTPSSASPASPSSNSTPPPSIAAGGSGRKKPTDAERKARLEARQARNRQSAQISRERKKAHMEELEVNNASLKLENDSLKKQLQAGASIRSQLESRVKELDSRVHGLESLIKELVRIVNPSPFQQPYQNQTDLVSSALRLLTNPPSALPAGALASFSQGEGSSDGVVGGVEGGVHLGREFEVTHGSSIAQSIQVAVGGNASASLQDFRGFGENVCETEKVGGDDGQGQSHGEPEKVEELDLGSLINLQQLEQGGASDVVSAGLEVDNGGKLASHNQEAKDQAEVPKEASAAVSQSVGGSASAAGAPGATQAQALNPCHASPASATEGTAKEESFELLTSSFIPTKRSAEDLATDAFLAEIYSGSSSGLQQEQSDSIEQALDVQDWTRGSEDGSNDIKNINDSHGGSGTSNGIKFDSMEAVLDTAGTNSNHIGGWNFDFMDLDLDVDIDAGPFSAGDSVGLGDLLHMVEGKSFALAPLKDQSDLTSKETKVGGESNGWKEIVQAS
ncbi:hypothetical protein IE53DRAFT_412751 [Violaceomyces palustris]|uniref:Uncharacterized protein n=1 Tax=Violaceomyces palustris TaxID=1673888 RepID=A0ACD0NPU2_9BASI|nr:hypothetical protein IE53DRAFT_412751 [Violaceomyces palustris]